PRRRAHGAGARGRRGRDERGRPARAALQERAPRRGARGDRRPSARPPRSARRSGGARRGASHEVPRERAGRGGRRGARKESMTNRACSSQVSRGADPSRKDTTMRYLVLAMVAAAACGGTTLDVGKNGSANSGLVTVNGTLAGHALTSPTIRAARQD